MYSSLEWMEARLGCAPNLPDPGIEAQSAPAKAKLCMVFTPLKQNIELLEAGVLQPLTHVVRLARGTLGITGGRVLVTVTEGLLVLAFDATVGAAVSVGTAGGLVRVTEVEKDKGALDLVTEVERVGGGRVLVGVAVPRAAAWEAWMLMP